jgi:hypothetical protein
MQVNVGKGIELSIDHTALPETALNHAIMIGLRNILMDSHASITTDEYPNADEREAAARAMVDKKLDALMRGEVRVQSTREGDPVRAEAMRMATDIIKSALRKAGRKIADVDAKALREKAAALVTPELLAKAKARVDETRAESAVDLSDLGL